MSYEYSLYLKSLRTYTLLAPAAAALPSWLGVCVLRILDEFHAHMSTQMITVIGAGNANKATNEASTRYILKHTYTHYGNLHTLE